MLPPDSTVRRADIVVLGGINTDFVVRGRELPAAGASTDGSVFVESPGGKGANAAVQCARLGVRTALIGRVGNDDRGRRLVAGLTEERVDISHVGTDDDAPTGAAVIQVDASGRKQIMASLHANLRLQPAHVHAAANMIRHARVLLMQLEIPVECGVMAARIAHDAGVRIVLDPAPPRPLPDSLIEMVDVVRGNGEEIAALTGVRITDRASARRAAALLRSRGVDIVVVGVDDGNLVAWVDGDEWLPELPVKRVDATGAGDAFSAALAVALCEGQSPGDAARFASGAAALATTVLGAQAGLPRRRELTAYLDRVLPVAG